MNENACIPQNRLSLSKNLPYMILRHAACQCAALWSMIIVIACHRGYPSVRNAGFEMLSLHDAANITMVRLNPNKSGFFIHSLSQVQKIPERISKTSTVGCDH